MNSYRKKIKTANVCLHCYLSEKIANKIEMDRHLVDKIYEMSHEKFEESVFGSQRLRPNSITKLFQFLPFDFFSFLQWPLARLFRFIFENWS